MTLPITWRIPSMSRQTSAGQRPPRRRLALDTLEDRTVPAFIRGTDSLLYTVPANGASSETRPTLGDFDGDGASDLAVVKPGVSPSVTTIQIHPSAGGVFVNTPETVLTLPAHYDYVLLATGNFNGDAYDDLVAAAHRPDGHADVFVYGGGAAGLTLKTPKTTTQTPVANPTLAVGDFLGDAGADIALLPGGVQTNLVPVLKNTGNFTFANAGTTPVLGGGAMFTGIQDSGVLPDVNGDGKADLIVIVTGGPPDFVGSLRVLRSGMNGFQMGSPLSFTGSPVTVAVGDLDGDGAKDDLAVRTFVTTPAFDDLVTLLKGQPNGVFDPLNFTHPDPANPGGPPVTDNQLNSDNPLQAVLPANTDNQGADEIIVMSPQGDVTLHKRQETPDPMNPGTPVVTFDPVTNPAIPNLGGGGGFVNYLLAADFDASTGGASRDLVAIRGEINTSERLSYAVPVTNVAPAGTKIDFDGPPPVSPVVGNPITLKFKVTTTGGAPVTAGAVSLFLLVGQDPVTGADQYGEIPGATGTVNNGTVSLTLTPDAGNNNYPLEAGDRSYVLAYEGTETFLESPFPFSLKVSQSIAQLESFVNYWPESPPDAPADPAQPDWTRVTGPGLSEFASNGSVFTIKDLGDTEGKLSYELPDAKLDPAKAAFMEATFRLPRGVGPLFPPGPGTVAFGFSDGANRFQFTFARMEGDTAVFALDVASGTAPEIRIPTQEDKYFTVLLSKRADGQVLGKVRDDQKKDVAKVGGVNAGFGPAAVDLPTDTAKAYRFGAPSDPGRSVSDWTRVYAGVGLPGGDVTAVPAAAVSLTVDQPTPVPDVLTAGLDGEAVRTFGQGALVGITVTVADPNFPIDPPEELIVKFGFGGTPGHPTGTPAETVRVKYTGPLGKATEFRYLIPTFTPANSTFAGTAIGNATVEAAGTDETGGPIKIGPAVFHLTGEASSAAPGLYFSDGNLSLAFSNGNNAVPVMIQSGVSLEMTPQQFLRFTVTADAVGGSGTEIFFNGDTRVFQTYSDPELTRPARSVREKNGNPPKMYVAFSPFLLVSNLRASYQTMPFAVIDTNTGQARQEKVVARVVGQNDSGPTLTLKLSQPQVNNPPTGGTIPFDLEITSTRPLDGVPRLQFKQTRNDLPPPQGFLNWLADPANPTAPPQTLRSTGTSWVYRIYLPETASSSELTFRAAGDDLFGGGEGFSPEETLVVAPVPEILDGARLLAEQNQPEEAVVQVNGAEGTPLLGHYILTNHNGQPVFTRLVAAPAISRGGGSAISRGGGSAISRGAGSIVAVGAANGLRVNPNGIVAPGAAGNLVDSEGFHIGIRAPAISRGGGSIVAPGAAGNFQPDRYLKAVSGGNTFFMLSEAYGGIVAPGAAGNVISRGAGSIFLPGGGIIAPGAGGILSFNGVALAQQLAGPRTGAISGLVASLRGGTFAASTFQASTTFNPVGQSDVAVRGTTAADAPAGASPTPAAAALDTLVQSSFLTDHAALMKQAGLLPADYEARMDTAALYLDAGKAVLGETGFDGLTPDQLAALVKAATVIPLKATPAVAGGTFGPGARVVLTPVNAADTLATGSASVAAGQKLAVSLAGTVVTVGGDEPLALQSDQDNLHIQLNGQVARMVSAAADKVVVRLPETLPVGERLLIALTTADGRLAFTSLVLEAAPAIPKNTITMTEPDGDKITVKLTGPGVLGVVQTDDDGDGIGSVGTIHVSGTKPTSKPTTSKLTVTVVKGKNGDGKTTVGAITGSDLKGITATTTTLDGLGVNLSGYLGGLTVRDIVNGAGVVAGGLASDAATVISAHDVGDGTEVILGSPVSLTVARFGDGLVSAPVLTALTVKGDALNKVNGVKTPIPGDFLADVTLTGSGDAKKPTALTSATVAGRVSNATWDVTGNTGAITVKGAATDWTLKATGTVASVAANGWAGGSLEAASLGLLNMPTGDLSTSVTLTGHLGGLSVRDILGGADVTAGGTAAQKTTFKAHVVGDNTAVTVGSTITSLAVARFGNGSVTAPAIGTLSATGDAAFKVGGVKAPIPGDFLADLTLTGTGNPKMPVSLTRATITGAVTDSAWTVTGNVGGVTVKKAATNWTVDATGSVASVAVNGWAGGSLKAASLGTLTVTGDLSANVTLTGAGVKPGKAALTSAKVTGTATGVTIDVTGLVNTVTVGAFVNSRLFAGFDPTASADPMSGGSFNTGGKITTFTATGFKGSPAPAFVNSVIAAETVGTVTLATADTSAAAVQEGVLGKLSIGAVTIGSPAFKYDKTGLAVQNTGNFFVKKG